MTVHHFFVPQKAIQLSRAIISGREHRHLCHVLRLRKGEKIRIFNEKGELFLGTIEKIELDKTVVCLEKTIELEPIVVPLTVAQACLRTKIMDWVVQKITELRVCRFIPLLTRRTVVRLSGNSQGKLARWRRLALEAAKQCQSSFIPEIYSPLKLNDFVLSCSEEEKYYLSEHGGRILRDIFSSGLKTNTGQKPDSAVVCVGPEGGWEKEEEELLGRHGFKPISLGKRIYRAETALLIVTSILTHFWNA